MGGLDIRSINGTSKAALIRQVWTTIMLTRKLAGTYGSMLDTYVGNPFGMFLFQSKLHGGGKAF